MEIKATVIGNLTEDVKLGKKDENTSFAIFKIAVNKSKEEVMYVTAFAYGVSEKRLEKLTTGSLVMVHGNYDDKIQTKPGTEEQYINRVVNVKDWDLLVPKPKSDEK